MMAMATVMYFYVLVTGLAFAYVERGPFPTLAACRQDAVATEAAYEGEATASECYTYTPAEGD